MKATQLMIAAFRHYVATLACGRHAPRLPTPSQAVVQVACPKPSKPWCQLRCLPLVLHVHLLVIRVHGVNEGINLGRTRQGLHNQVVEQWVHLCMQAAAVRRAGQRRQGWWGPGSPPAGQCRLPSHCKFLYQCLCCCQATREPFYGSPPQERNGTTHLSGRHGLCSLCSDSPRDLKLGTAGQALASQQSAAGSR